MATGEQVRRLGIRQAPVYTSVVALTIRQIYTMSPQRTGVIRKLMVTNRQAGTVNLFIGTGVDGAAAPLAVQTLPMIQCLGAGLTTTFGEDELPGYIFSGNIACTVSAAGAAPADVQVAVEVEEYS